MASTPFINIHSHSRSTESDTIRVYNCIIGKDEDPVGLFSAGIHPWYINEDLPEMQLSELFVLASDDKCIAIGECGLDKLKGSAPDLQESVFRSQIEMAAALEKPLIIHCVKRFAEVLHCLEAENFGGRFMLHGINTNPENIKPFLQMQNAFFSFGTAVLQPGSNAETIFKSLDPEKCFLETDDRSTDIKNVYFRAAEIKGMSVNELSDQVLRNYKKVFVHGIDRTK
ncbi:MAG: hypothetical protein K0S33_2718 [Bacteroidetes bacterium]|jgi:TatD DNase family protein|nr:hypothetical protein [Bacteroidota bacterium]